MSLLFSRISSKTKISCLMLLLLVLPALAELIVLVDCDIRTLELMLVFDVVLSLFLFIPLSSFMCYIGYLSHVQEMNLFCESLRYGKKHKPLNLPAEEPGEDEILSLKRNLIAKKAKILYVFIYH